MPPWPISRRIPERRRQQIAPRPARGHQQGEGRDPDNDVTGSFILPDIGAGTLSNPEGTVIVSNSDTLDFQANLTMWNSLDDSDVQIEGLLNVNPDWFAAE